MEDFTCVLCAAYHFRCLPHFTIETLKRNWAESTSHVADVHARYLWRSSLICTPMGHMIVSWEYADVVFGTANVSHDQGVLMSSVVG